MRGGERLAPFPECAEVGVRDHVAVEAVDLGALIGILDQDADCLGVLEHVEDVAGRARRVDRSADRADERECEVEERPLEGRPREESERRALLYTQVQQPVG